MKLTKEELSAALQRIAHELHTQDNLATQDPVYCVQERIRKRRDGRETWLTVESFFTRKSAMAYIEYRSYRHNGMLRLYVESAHNNWELRVVRQHLMEMFPKQEGEAAK